MTSSEPPREPAGAPDAPQPLGPPSADQEPSGPRPAGPPPASTGDAADGAAAGAPAAGDAAPGTEFEHRGPPAPRAPADTPAPPGEPPPQVLLSGHLHPAVLLLRLIDALRSAALPVLLGVLLDPIWLAFAGFVLLWNLGFGLARYLTVHYTLTRAELVVREGILHRQERRIPIDRVQDLGFESSILRRVLGVAVVMVETASSKGAEATLDSLGRGEAEHLRETLLAERALQARTASAAGTASTSGTDAPGATDPAAAPGPRPAPEPEWTVFASRGGELLLRGVTDLRLSAILVTGFAALELADQIGLAVRLRGLADTFFDWLWMFPPATVALLLVLLVGVVLVGSAAVAAIGNLMVFHGFRLTLRGDNLLRRYGLLTTRQKTLPRARIQRVTVEQNWLRRLLGHVVVHADSAGSGRGAGEEAPGGFDVVVPMASERRALALLPALLPRLQADDFVFRRASPRLVHRSLLRGVLGAAVLGGVLAPAAGWYALGALVLVPLSGLVGRLAWGNLAYGHNGRHLWLRFGVLGRFQAFVPVAKIQAAAQQAGPLQQALGLADVTVYVAGGSPTRLPDLPVEDARALQSELAQLAAAAAGPDWRRADGLRASAGS